MTQASEPSWFDDTDGTPAAETVFFSLEGEKYVIDLNGENATALRAAFEKYIAAGRQVVTPAEAGVLHPGRNRSHRYLGRSAWRSANG